ncbi:MAG: hypothetical protein ACPGU1_08925 [Myxococcota bacterium]
MSLRLPLSLAMLGLLLSCGSPPASAPQAPALDAATPPRAAAPEVEATRTSAETTTPEPARAEPKAAPISPAAPTPPLTFKEAMLRIATCDRADDGLMLADPASCLAPMRQAYAALLDDESASGATTLPATLNVLLSHAEPTVVFYTLMEHGAHLQSSPETIKLLEGLLSSLLAPIAEAAATTRLSLKGDRHEEIRKRALSLFGTHPQRRVRHAACRHLGGAAYKGDREVFSTLITAARDTKRDHLLRACAAREAGHVATARNLKTLIGLLDTLDIQQPTIVGLQRGLGTPKAIAAYVRWFDRHATQPDKLHWTAMHVFLPWDTELDRMPRSPTISVLQRIAGHLGHTGQVRSLAIEGLKRLKAEEALVTLRKGSTPTDPPEVKSALGR